MIMVAAFVCCMSCSDDENGDVRDAFVGSYRIEETAIVDGLEYKDNYNITIVKSSVSNTDIVISNILNTGASVNATVSGVNFNIQQQTINSAGVNGSGRLEGTLIRFSVLVTQPNGLVNFTCEGPKQ
jgi:hypothetical protein